MKIYTKNGDNGSTMLWSGELVLKSDVHITTLGQLDELTVRIGNVITHTWNKKLIAFLRETQKIIQDINTIIATPTPTKKIKGLGSEIVDDLESQIDYMTDILPKLSVFILPCEYELDGYIHLCRTQTRIVETMLPKVINYRAVDLDLDVSDLYDIQKYINRLSDYFFTLARFESYRDSEYEFLIENFVYEDVPDKNDQDFFRDSHLMRLEYNQDLEELDIKTSIDTKINNSCYIPVFFTLISMSLYLLCTTDLADHIEF